MDKVDVDLKTRYQIVGTHLGDNHGTEKEPIETLSSSFGPSRSIAARLIDADTVRAYRGTCRHRVGYLCLVHIAQLGSIFAKNLS